MKIKKKKSESVDSFDYPCIVPVCCKIAKFPSHNGRLLSLAVSAVLFLTIRSVVRSRQIVEGSRSDWPKEVGQDSVSSGFLLRSGCQPGELFYTLARLAIHCNHSKRTQCQYQTAVLDRLARNRYNRLRCSPTVCRGNDRCYTQHRVIGFLRLLPIAVPDSRELDIAK